MKKSKFFVKFFIVFALWQTMIYAAHADPVSIAVLKSRDLEPYNTALASFEKALNDKGRAVNLLYYDLKGNVDDGERICKDIRDANPGLILTLGTEATKVARENIKDIPIVFSVVLDPVGSGFVEKLEGSGNNLTGVAFDVPVKVQFETLTSIMPKIRRIGVVYNPQKTGRVLEEADLIAERMGLELIRVTVSSRNDVPQAMESLLGRVDALWAPVDNTVYNPQSAQFIILFTLRNKIPFMAFSDQLVKAGAMVGLRSDYKIQGEEAAYLAIRILDGEEPSRISIVLSEKSLLFLNKRVADLIGIDFSPEVIKSAKEIFE